MSVPFKQLVAVFDSEENEQLMNDEKIVYMYGGFRKEDPSSAVVIEQAEEIKSIAMFSNQEVNFELRKLDTIMIQPSSLVTCKVT